MMMMSFHSRKNLPTSSSLSLLSIILASITIGSSLLFSPADGANKNDTTNKTQIDSFQELHSCFEKSVYSFYLEASFPPTTKEALRASCQRQLDGFKCLKDKSRNAPALIKRGINSFVQTRQRFQKKYCTNLNSDASKRHVSDMKCVMDKKSQIYRDLDVKFINSLHEIRRRNYNDSAIELKYLCCSLVNYRKDIIGNTEPECAASKQGIEEMILSIVSNDISLICDDEEKLTTKICPALEPFKNIQKTIAQKDMKIGASALVLYLVMTLGEPDSNLS